MDTQTNYTIVGLFITTLFAAIVLSIIWLSSGFSFEEYQYYQIYMRESVSGLNIDSPVEYNGVAVGSVKSIELNHEDPQMVDLLLSIKKETPITQGTIATLTTRGLTGLVYIALKDDSTNLAPLKAMADEPYPVIPTTPSIFVRIDTAFTQLNQSLQDLSASVRSVIDPENQQSLKEILLNTKEMTKQINREFFPLIKSTRRTVEWIDSQFLPSTYQIFSNINTMATQLSQLTEQVERNPSVLIRGSAEAPLGPGETR